MIGRRIADEHWNGFDDLQPGDYAKFPNSTLWAIVPPDGVYCHIDATKHRITEHEDGTITVSPSILRYPSRTNDPGWHGFLERGVWRAC
jgi:hypothetical protein